MIQRSVTTVLVTGASGFVGMHCVAELLRQGYRVRGTVRTMAREEQLRDALAPFTTDTDALVFVAADLLQDEGWETAVAGCDYVLHVASPFPAGLPKHEDDLIIPAREGTLRVLRAASAAGVRRLVLTSSVAAVSSGHADDSLTYDEDDWSDLSEDIGAYAKSKTLAERAAWDYVNNLGEENALEMTAINPGFIMGPLLMAGSLGTSAQTIRNILAGANPGTARVSWTIVDVRDVAAAHVAAMTSPVAAGKRYICAADLLWMEEVAEILHTEFAGRGYKFRTRQLPDVLVRMVALFDPAAKSILPSLGRQTHLSTARIKQDLNWQPRSAAEAVTAMGASLIELGAV